MDFEKMKREADLRTEQARQGEELMNRMTKAKDEKLRDMVEDFKALFLPQGFNINNQLANLSRGETLTASYRDISISLCENKDGDMLSLCYLDLITKSGDKKRAYGIRMTCDKDLTIRMALHDRATKEMPKVITNFKTTLEDIIDAL